MFTLPYDATDDELRHGVVTWFRLIASGRDEEAAAFLAVGDPEESMTVSQFVSRIFELTDGGKVTAPQAIPEFDSDDDVPIDGPMDIVCRWIPGPNTTEKHPGCVADIVHTIPVDGKWSDIDASFFIRAENGLLSLQLHDIVGYDEE